VIDTPHCKDFWLNKIKKLLKVAYSFFLTFRQTLIGRKRQYEGKRFSV